MDAKIFEAYGDYYFKENNFIEAARLYEKSYSITKHGKLLFKIWDSFQNEGYVAKSGEFGQLYLEFLFKYRLQFEIDSFIRALENTGFDRKKLVGYKLKRDLLNGNIDGAIEFFSKINFSDEFIQVEIASELLRKRKFWKTVSDLRQPLFELYINLSPVDSEEEKIIKRQLLESIFADLLESGVTPQLEKNISRYANKYNPNMTLEKLQSDESNEMPDFSTMLSLSDFKEEIEFLISAREFTQAKNLVDDMLLSGFDNDEVERLERRIKIQEEATLRDITLVKKLLVEEIEKFHPSNLENEELGQDEYKVYFTKQIEELNDSFSFDRARKIFNEMGMMKFPHMLEGLIELCQENYTELNDSEQTELEYFNLTNMYEQKDYAGVVAVSAKVIKNRPLNKNEVAMFLLMKKKAYTSMSRLTEAEDVEKAIKTLFSEN